MSYFIVPAITDQAGQCRIVHRAGFTGDPGKSYRQEPDLWKDVGVMNSQGKLVALDAPKEVWDGIKMCEPLMGGLIFADSDFHAVQLKILGDANPLRELFLNPDADRFSMVHVDQEGESHFSWCERQSYDPIKATATVATIAENGDRGEPMMLRVNLRGEPLLNEKQLCSVLRVGVGEGFDPDDVESNQALTEALTSRLWWTSTSEDGLHQDVDELVLNGAHICSIEWEDDREVVGYTFALDRTHAQKILKYAPDDEEWMVEDDGVSAIGRIAAGLKDVPLEPRTPEDSNCPRSKP